MYRVLLCVLLTISFTKSEIYRLEESVRPVQYSIKILPDFDTDNFTGEVTIEVDVQSERPSIVLHSIDLHFTKVLLDNETANFTEQPNVQTITVFPVVDGKPITKGRHVLQFEYEGRLTLNERRGFNKATYGVNSENEQFLLVTDLQPNGARSVFPSFDEPSFKANFTVTLISSNSSFYGLSNMEMINKSTDEETGRTTYNFAPSLKMSSYLVCLIFTNFPYDEDSVEVNGKTIKLRMYSHQKNHTIPFKLAKNALKVLTEFTDIDYPLKKLDFIEYNRMIVGTENWGMTTLRQGSISTEDNIYDQFQIAHILTHEIAHSWFGNLVTNEWWEDLWLQEGLVTFLTLKLRSYVEGKNSSRYGDEYSDAESPTDTYQKRALVESIDDEGIVFDLLTYDKGSKIFLMLEELLSPKGFQNLLRNLLKKYQYSSVNTKQFVALIDDDTLRESLESYIYQKSYPMINIRRKEDQFILTQTPWRVKDNDTQFEGSRWTIPIKYNFENCTNSTLVWFKKDMKELIIPANGSKILILNKSRKCLYRYNYAADIWNDIIENAEHLDKLDMKAISKEADYMYVAGYENCSITLRMFKKIRRTNFIWTNFIQNAMYMNLLDNKAADIFMKYINRCEDGRDGRKLSPHFFYNNRTKPEKKLDLKGLETCIKWINESLRNEEDEQQNFV